MTPTDDKPDPTAIDLEKATEIYAAFKLNPQSRHGYREEFMRDYAPNLIAAVEALREQVAEYDSLFDIAAQREQPWIEAWRKATGNPGTLPDYGKLLAWICDRAEAAEARGTELAGALAELLLWHRNEGADTDEPPSAFLHNGATALASTPAKALKRARAIQKVAEHLWIILPLAKGYVDKNNVGNNTQFIADAEEALDALDKESTP